MAEETKDQATVEKPEPSSESPKLPERGFFRGDDMAKFAEQLETTGKPSTEAPAKKEKRPCPEGVPCSDAEEKEAKPEEGKPYKILKVRGREIPVESEEKLIEYAQLGLNAQKLRQRDADWERDLEAREDRMERLSPHIQRIVEFLDGGGELPGARAPRKEEPQPEEEILDPVAADRVKRLEERLGSLEKENQGLKGKAQEDSYEKAQRNLTETFDGVVKEVPFEQVLDEEGRNISRDLFSALAALKINQDAMKLKTTRGFKMKTMTEYMKDTASDLAYLEKHFRGNGPGEVSADIVKMKFPKVAEDLGKEAIDAYLKRVEESGEPIIRSTKTEPSVGRPKKEFKGIGDAIDQALADQEIFDGLTDLGKKFRIQNP
jgi:hypothetical protein